MTDQQTMDDDPLAIASHVYTQSHEQCRNQERDSHEQAQASGSSPIRQKDHKWSPMTMDVTQERLKVV